MKNSVDPDQMASLEAIWSGSTKGNAHPGSAGQGLRWIPKMYWLYRKWPTINGHVSI